MGGTDGVGGRRVRPGSERERTSLREEQAARLAAAFVARPGARWSAPPILYELGPDDVVLRSWQALRPAAGGGEALFDGTWRLSRRDLAAHRAHEAAPALAALVAAGTTPRGSLLIDLVAARVTSLAGAPDHCEERLAAMARDAFTRRFCEIGRVIAVGLAPTGGSGADALVASPAAALACLEADRAGGPTVVLVGSAACEASAALAELLARATQRPECGVLLARPSPEARAVVAPGPDGAGNVFLSALGAPRGERSSAGSTPPRSEPIEVAVLGPVEVRGSTIPLERRPKLTELVVYLAMHPEGATTRTWATALWPERRVPPQTVANRLSEARRALGFASDGRPRLRRSGERHLIADFTTDWAAFLALSSPEAGPQSWREALGLLRGRPFGELRECQWATLEGLASEMEQAAVACGLRYGEHALADGRPDEATWAAQRALRTSPWDERLHRLAMRAADAAGNRAGVEATLRHLALVLELDGDPLAGVHPLTAALYTDLVAGTRAP
ncbi:MAG TPA: BTAD domain-containing putative transcriptional regulator [Acidimicrobiales bacterium]|nr:BTAD domain-containing putative transcriptional regulator [Acidimicrobiales bacterium]